MLPVPLRARAHLLGDTLDLRGLDGERHLVRRPLQVPVGRGSAVLFRWGAAATFGLDAAEESAFLSSLARWVGSPVTAPETEEAMVAFDEAEERLEPDGTIVLRNAEPERLQVVAEVLAKSAVLAYHEARVAEAFDRIEPLAKRMRTGTRPSGTVRQLLAHLGDALFTQARTIVGAEVTEKPEVTWDRPDLDRLYERLRSEYELVERDEALTRKAELVGEMVLAA